MTGHPVFWLLLAAVAAPLLAELPVGFKVPVVVLEVVLGIVLGPHVLDLVRFGGFVESMFVFGMAATLFMAGMELDFGAIKGRPLALAAGGWGLSLLLAVAVAALLRLVPAADVPMAAALALCTTGLGILIPIFRDAGDLETPFGRLAVAAGTLGEIAPVVAMSLFLSQRYSTWQEMGFLLAFLAIVAGAVAVGMGARPPRVLTFLERQMQTSTQLPVRIALLMLAGLYMLAEQFGFESIFGAFAAGMILGQTTRGPGGETLRLKLDAVTFGWFYPFFFVGTGIRFDVAALGRDLATALMVPAFLALMLVIRGAPVLLYRDAIDRAQRLPFALFSAIPSLSMVVIITEIGRRTGTMSADVAAALIGAALLAALIFPTVAGVLLRAPSAETTRSKTT